MLAEVEDVKRQLASRAAAAHLSADACLRKAENVNGTTVIVAEAPSANANLMRQLIDQIRKKASPSAVFLATTEGENKVVLVAGVSRELVEQGVSAGNWVRDVAPVVGGGGGGKPDLAQAGGKQPEKLPDALAKAKEVARAMLGACTQFNRPIERPIARDTSDRVPPALPWWPRRFAEFVARCGPT